MVRSEGNMSLKNPVTPPGIQPGTVRLVAQRLNHYATPGPIIIIIIIIIIDIKCRNCPSVRSTSATNAIGGDTDIFNGRSLSAYHWLESDTFIR